MRNAPQVSTISQADVMLTNPANIPALMLLRSNMCSLENVLIRWDLAKRRTKELVQEERRVFKIILDGPELLGTYIESVPPPLKNIQPIKFMNVPINTCDALLVKGSSS